MKMRAFGGCSSGTHDWVKTEIPRGVFTHSLAFFSFLDLKYSSSGMSPHGNNNVTGAAGGVSSAIVITWRVTLVWVFDQFLLLVCLLLDATPKFFLHKTSHIHILLYCEADPHQGCSGFLFANCIIYKSTSIFLGGHEASCQRVISSLSLSLYLCHQFSCFSYKNDALQKSSRKATSSSFYFTLLSLFPKPWNFNCEQ